MWTVKDDVAYVVTYSGMLEDASDAFPSKSVVDKVMASFKIIKRDEKLRKGSLGARSRTRGTLD
jgi:hypothetical protein